jgi:hypothetical protein
MNTILEQAMMITGITIEYIVNFIHGSIYLFTLLNQVSPLFLGNAHRSLDRELRGVFRCADLNFGQGCISAPRARTSKSTPPSYKSGPFDPHLAWPGNYFTRLNTSPTYF